MRLAAVLITLGVSGAPPLHHVHSRPGECVIVIRMNAPAPDVSNAPECDRKTSPASTFKIPHALIALETRVVDSATLFKWDGTRYDFESWRRDHTLDSAIKASVYPFFQRTARLIGRQRMKRHLASIGYASDRFDGELTTFWTNGDLVISPREQVVFLQRMFSGKLPVDPRHVATVKSALTMPADRIANAAGVHPFPLNWPGTIVRAKTGNTTVDGERVSWLVGQLQSADAEFVFASRVRSSDTSLPSTAGADLAVRVLNQLNPYPLDGLNPLNP
jgi:beta-lactamase class D